MQEKNPPTRRYWFQARQTKFGGFRPVTWEGWCVVLGYIVAWLVGPMIFSPTHQFVALGSYLVGVTVLLMLVHELKGEPPR